MKCWPQLTASKTLFQELARSANLQAAGKRPVLQRQLQNGRLPYDVQGLFQGVGATAPISLTTGGEPDEIEQISTTGSEDEG